MRGGCCEDSCVEGSWEVEGLRGGGTGLGVSEIVALMVRLTSAFGKTIGIHGRRFGHVRFSCVVDPQVKQVRICPL